MTKLEKGKQRLTLSSLTWDGITKELCENITKEIEKLRRQSENISMRKTLATKGKVEEEMTPYDISHKITNELEEKGCNVIYAHPEWV